MTNLGMFFFLAGTCLSLNTSSGIDNQGSCPYFSPALCTSNVSEPLTHLALNGSKIVLPYTSYDAEFTNIIGGPPVLAANGTSGFAYEAGVWVYDHNQVWFTSVAQPAPDTSFVSVLDLATGNVFQPEFKFTGCNQTSLVNPNGGYYFNGLVYLAIAGTTGLGGAIVAISPVTYEVTEVVNSYYGLPLSSVDDLAWVCGPRNETYLYFSALDFTPLGLALATPQLPNAVWRFDPRAHSLEPVIARADVLIPNGVAVSQDFSHLYITDDVPTTLFGAGDKSSGSPAIYRFDLDGDFMPTQKRLISFVREGIADGIKVDDRGRIWTGEGQGIVVRNPQGKTLGIINSSFFLDADEELAFANFALAGDMLVVEAINSIYLVSLTETVVSPTRFHC